MKKILIFAILALSLNIVQADEIEQKKVYECVYLEDAPYGVLAWSQSDWIKKDGRGESRFLNYNSDEAKGLVLDATAERGVERDPQVAVRDTTFYTVYNDKGWYLYIHATEPLIDDIMDSLVDPQSAARLEGFEIFFAPGLKNVPYYQIFTRTFADQVNFYDWGAPHANYRSLKSYAKVESLPLKDGFGTFVFVPWEALYDRLPFSGDYWRFSIIRWMPYAKAGGVTWGGQVHDTGNFNLIRFAKPTTEQRAAIEMRILKAAWFKFNAAAKQSTEFWNDSKLGDQEFFKEALQPTIEQYITLGKSFGEPGQWTPDTIERGRAVISNWMEFHYVVSALRGEYLTEKRFKDSK